MIFRIVGKALILIGLAIVLYGGIEAFSNQPQDTATPQFAIPDFHRQGEIEKENRLRRPKEQEGIMLLVVGGVIAITGGLLDHYGQTKTAQSKQDADKGPSGQASI